MSTTWSFSLEPWKNLNSRNKSNAVRFKREDLLKELCLKKSEKYTSWVFVGHVFLTCLDLDVDALISFSISPLNEAHCELSHLDIKRGANGSIVDITEVTDSGQYSSFEASPDISQRTKCLINALST